MRGKWGVAFAACVLGIASAGARAAPDADPSVSPMRAVIDRYAEDRGALSRAYGDRVSPDRRRRLGEFVDERAKQLEAVDFDKLDQAGKVDYLLLRNELHYERKQLAHRQHEIDEVASLLPFSATVIGLEEARRRVDPIDPEKTASALVDLSRQVAEVRKALEEKLKAADASKSEAKTGLPTPVLANRAARLTDELRDVLKEWHGFYAGYDPEFTWWARQPYPKADKDLEDYAKFLRTKLAGFPEKPDEDEPVIGDPIGRAALLDALEAEGIAYTPEELIEIANREFAWCEVEMKRAADDLGCDGDWKKALALVSQKHVKPGEQPRLIKQLAEEATDFVEGHDLVTVPALCKETWRMEMMSVERQKVNPYFTGGEVISVSFPTDTMAHEDKLMSLRGNNAAFCRATVFHELIPGHHLQLFMAERYNAHRRVFDTPFLVEGWALYWEMLLWDMKFPRNAEDRVGMLFWRSHRCARIIFSLKFHLGQMTAKEAIDFLVDRVGHERRNATAEVRRSVAGNYGPLYQAAYMLGGLQIRAMRQELVDSKKMTDRQFHDAILRENSIPIAMIRAALTKQSLTRDFRSDWRFYGEVGSGEKAEQGRAPEAQAAAETVRAARPELRVYRDKVEPHWIDGGSRFWYRNTLPGGKTEAVLVDAEKGTRTAAADLAALGVKEAEENIDPDRLAAERMPRPSRNGGADTQVTFANETTSDVRLYWSDADGKRQPYGSIKPGERHAQHTFAGHVWVVTGRDDEVVAVFEATDKPATAVINGKGGADRQRPRRRREGGTNQTGRPENAARSPDGKYEAFVRDHNLWLRVTDSKEEFCLSEDGTPQETYGRDVYRERALELAAAPGARDERAARPEVRWSPDSKHLVAMRSHTVSGRTVYMVESSPRDQLQPKLQSYPYLKPGDDIPVETPRLFDAERRKSIAVDDALFKTPFAIDGVRWDKDSSRFTLLYNQRGHQVLRVVAVDANSGAAKALVEETSPTFIDYSGKQFLEYLEDAGEIVWMSERDGWNHLYLCDAKTGAVKNQITKGEWVVRAVEKVDADKRQVWFRAGGVVPGKDPYYVHLCRVNFDGTGMKVLTEGDGTHSTQFSPDRRFFLDTSSRVDQPPVTELRKSDDGSLVCRLEEADTSELTSAGARPPIRFAAKARDGTTDIYGVIHLPHDFDPSRKYPVLENIYAGPQDAYVPKAFRGRYPQQRLADRGMVVVQIDGMGTSQRSKKFHDVCWKNLADAGFPDRIAWMRAAAEKYPWMDLSRVGVYGGSAGGQNALGALLFHGDFYKVAAADCGCHDNRMDKLWWNEQWMGYPVGPEYPACSNVTNASKLTGKLLLTVGELDRNVDPASTMQVADALVKADKDFELLVIPGAGHGAGTGTPYGRRRTEEFLVRNLVGVAGAGAAVGGAGR